MDKDQSLLKSSLRRIRSDLSLQILALYTLLLIPIVVGALVFDRYSVERLRQDVMSEKVALAKAIAQETETTIQNSLTAIDQLSQQDAVLDADIAALEPIFDQVYRVRPEVNLIYRLGPDGIMLFHFPVGPSSTLGIDFSHRDYYQRALTTKEPIVSLGRISPTTNQPVATAVKPLWDGDEFLGVVATNLKLENLSTTLASIVSKRDQEKRFEVVIIDAAGKIIASPNPEDLLLAFNTRNQAAIDAVLGGESGNVIGVDESGEEILYSYVPVPSANWGVIVIQPTAIAFATPTIFHNSVLLIIGVFLAIGIFFWLTLANRVIKPVETLSQYSQAISQSGEHSDRLMEELSRYSTRKDQMGHLIRSFSRMEKALNARIKELGTLVEVSAAVVSSLDTDTVLERILEQVERLLDIDKSMILALDEGSGVFRARASRGLSKRYTDEMVVSPDETGSVTMRALSGGAPVIIEDTENDPSFIKFKSRAHAEGYRSVASIPLNTTYAPPSVLLVYSQKPNVFTKRIIDLLTTFANQAVMAIENAQFYAISDMQLQKQSRRLEALVHSLDVGLILEDLNGHVLYVNRSAAELAETLPEHVTDKPVNYLCDQICNHAKDIDHAQAQINELLSSNRTKEFNLALEYHAGIRQIRFKGFTVTDKTGMLIGQGQILQDITKEFELDHMKSSLIATVSHELRTPLAAIKGYATTLLAEDVDWEQQAQHEFLDIISKEADRLSNLVNNLLDMSRIEAGSIHLSQIECDISEIIQRSIDSCYTDQKDRIETTIPNDLPLIFADAQRIEVVVRNLIENAIKYSETNTPIEIIVDQEEGYLITKVEDQGLGIPVDKTKDVFESFYRLDNGLSRRKQGVGLGLTISRGFIHAHGGDIWVEPRKVGTCIAFSLPVAQDTELEGIIE